MIKSLDVEAIEELFGNYIIDSMLKYFQNKTKENRIKSNNLEEEYFHTNKNILNLLFKFYKKYEIQYNFTYNKENGLLHFTTYVIKEDDIIRDSCLIEPKSFNNVFENKGDFLYFCYVFEDIFLRINIQMKQHFLKYLEEIMIEDQAEQLKLVFKNQTEIKKRNRL